MLQYFATPNGANTVHKNSQIWASEATEITMVGRHFLFLLPLIVMMNIFQVAARDT